MDNLSSEQFLTLVKNIVEKHGCKIVDFDLQKRILNIEGPEEAQEKCATALSEIFD